MSITVVGQKDSLQIGEKYLEDQLYLDISYNVFYKQPTEFTPSSFSYGFSLGYIRDIPLVPSGKFALGLGVGYGYDSFSHGHSITENNNIIEIISTNAAITNNKLSLHNLEIPLQIRIRTSDAKTYAFWRIYTGVKFTYNLHNRFRYDENGIAKSFTNTSSFNRWQTGLTVSAGYGAFNVYVYYGLDSLFKNVLLDNNTPVQTKMYKIGVSFYLL
jgi:hypothetical protein